MQSTLFGPENLVIAATVHDEGADMAGHGGPVNVRIHRLSEFDRVAGKQQKASKRRDLVEFGLTVVAEGVEDRASAETTPTPTVDLSLTKTVDVLEPAVGTQVVFTLALSNATLPYVLEIASKGSGLASRFF